MPGTAGTGLGLIADEVGRADDVELLDVVPRPTDAECDPVAYAPTDEVTVEMLAQDSQLAESGYEVRTR